MGLSRRMFTKEFKLAAVQRLERGGSMGEVARALEVNPNVLHRWRREIREGPGNVFPGHGKQRWAEGAHCKVGAQDRPAGSGNRFFEEVLAAHRGTADAAGVDWKSAVYQKVQEEVKTGSGLTVGRMVKLGRVPGPKLLPFRCQRAGSRPRYGFTRRDPERSRWSGPATGVRA